MRKAMILGLALAGITLLLTEPAAALRWGHLEREDCFGRDGCWVWYKAILWDIPPGNDWEQTCKHTVNPQTGAVPTLCQKGVNMWGKWLYRSHLPCDGRRYEREVLWRVRRGDPLLLL
jgi:hypothetical protein